MRLEEPDRGFERPPPKVSVKCYGKRVGIPDKSLFFSQRNFSIPNYFGVPQAGKPLERKRRNEQEVML
jgi:hypothetical protein